MGAGNVCTINPTGVVLANTSVTITFTVTGSVAGFNTNTIMRQVTINRTAGVAFPGTFVLINPGSFQMGSATGSSAERPVRTVTLTRAFWLQTTEVTQGQWQAVMGSNPSRFSGCGLTCPVENVHWDDVQQFLARLNAQDPGKGYRLPTEAEWEYAARAGTTGDYGGNGVLNDMGWYVDNSGARTHPVGEKRPNAWGLYDLHGNVWEWVEDWYDADYYGRGVDTAPPGPSEGTRRVLRGGTWDSTPLNARSATRDHNTPVARRDNFGFRLARTP
jgi:formylglycine-generating enzyme required for sulfatase activity